MNKKIIIIGGGLTGLAAGIYARMNGYQAEIFESHSSPGGVCTSWERKGYTFDGAFHFWLGSVTESPFYKFFNEMGIYPQTEVIKRELFTMIKLKDGSEFKVWANNDKFKKELLAIAPEDKEAIELFFQEIKDIGSVEMPVDKPQEAYGFFDGLKMIFKEGHRLKTIQKYMKMPVSDYVIRFQSLKLREILSKILAAFCPIFVVLNCLYIFNYGDGNFPKGGARKFVNRIEKKLKDLGGIIHYNSRVKKILVKENQAIGIGLENGDQHHGDWIISAADGYSTIFKMLDGKYTGKKIQSIYNELDTYKPLVQVSLGIKADLSEYPHAYIIEEPKKIREIQLDLFSVRHYCYDNTMAPEKCSTVIVMIPSDYNLWKEASSDKQDYKQLKKEFEKIALELVEKIYPKSKNKIEVSDVATPMTTIRYTSNWKASYEGWLPTIKNLNTVIPKTLPGLKNFRMAGQWTEPGGGISTALMSGNHALYMICKKDKKPFLKA